MEQFRSVLMRSTLGERRPIDNEACLRGMLKHANLSISAWDTEKLVGIARSVTDFHYCCYVSDLAVDIDFQKQGVGKGLLKRTQEQLEPSCMIILLSAPSAVDYYPHIGFQHHPQAYWLKPAVEIR